MEDEADVGVDTISKAVVRIVLHDFLYRVPIVGRWFSRAVTQAERRIDDLRHFAEKNLHVKDVSATHTHTQCAALLSFTSHTRPKHDAAAGPL